MGEYAIFNHVFTNSFDCLVNNCLLKLRSHMYVILLCSDVYKLNNIISSFQEFLDNLYKPLFEVTIDPRLHPQLHMFLQYVSYWLLYDNKQFHNYGYCTADISTSPFHCHSCQLCQSLCILSKRVNTSSQIETEMASKQDVSAFK